MGVRACVCVCVCVCALSGLETGSWSFQPLCVFLSCRQTWRTFPAHTLSCKNYLQRSDSLIGWRCLFVFRVDCPFKNQFALHPKTENRLSDHCYQAGLNDQIQRRFSERSIGPDCLPEGTNTSTKCFNDEHSVFTSALPGEAFLLMTSQVYGRHLLWRLLLVSSQINNCPNRTTTVNSPFRHWRSVCACVCDVWIV